MCERCVTRRAVLKAGAAASLAGALGLGPGVREAAARPRLLVETLCAYAGRADLSRLAPGSRRAAREVALAGEAIGYRGAIRVYRGDAENALAAKVRDRSGESRRLIVYSARFLEALERHGGPAAPLSVLAHEVGHHANGDLEWRAARRSSWSRELSADYVSGLALARLGYRAEESTRALRLMFRRYGTRTHPDTPRRMGAMIAGWRDGGRREPLALN